MLHLQIVFRHPGSLLNVIWEHSTASRTPCFLGQDGSGILKRAKQNYQSNSLPVRIVKPSSWSDFDFVLFFNVTAVQISKTWFVFEDVIVYCYVMMKLLTSKHCHLFCSQGDYVLWFSGDSASLPLFFSILSSSSLLLPFHSQMSSFGH